MKLVKSLLLGSAAGLAAVAGAQAADLPVRKAAPVEYVRICSAYGAGFFYIPGTDTCLRVSGRARFEYQYTENFSRNGAAGSVSGYRGLGRMNLDARTQTAYGTLRAFVRFDIASRTGAYLFSGSQNRSAGAFPGQGIDQGQTQKFVDVDKAFVQFAGITAGRAASFFDFYAHDFELIGSSLGSDQASTNLFGYTAQLGNGFSATISAEDPTFRRTPVFNIGAFAGATAAQTAFNTFTNVNAQTPVLTSNGIGALDITQKNRMPDFVGNLRYDAPWGSAQISAAVHEIALGSYVQNAVFALPGTAIPAGTVPNASRPSNAYGWAVQGGIKVNAPFIAAGDAFYLQGAYGQGAQNYAGISSWAGFDTPATSNTSVISVTNVDAVVNPFTRRMELTDAFTVVGSFLHYWSPEWRSAFFGSYGELHFPTGSRAQYIALSNVAGTGIGGFLPTNTAANVNSNNFNAALRDWSILYVGASLIWSPVRDLDIGVEGVYQRLALINGTTGDLNRPGNIGSTINATGGPTQGTGIPLRTRSVDDNFLLRFRVQRDF